MNRFCSLCLSAIFVVLYLLTPFTPSAAQDAETLHWAAWDSALAVSEANPAQRYAYYAYHTLAVPHPEIYLQSDALFSSVIEAIPGSRSAFKGADVRNIELFQRLLHEEQEGPSFKWRMWVPTADSIYDASPFGFNKSWLDFCVASAAILLPAPSPQMSTTEAAMMRYTQLRRGGESDSAMFVVVDVNGHGYLARDGVLFSAKSGNPWDGDPASLVPALIFNERFVVYPLFGRDDRPKSLALTSLVGKLSPPARPELSAADSARAERLVTAAALPTRGALDLARISAMGALSIENKLIAAMWHDLLGQTEEEVSGCEAGMLRLIYYRANLLCPSTAVLAAAGNVTPFDSAAAAWERLYLRWSGRLVNPRDTVNQVYESGGYLWAYELLELTFDGIIRTRAGAGSSQTLAMAAALDMLNIPNMRVEIDAGDNAKPNQHWILSDAGKWQFNYGHWRRVGNLGGSASRIPMIIHTCATGDHWTNLIIPFLYTNIDPLTISHELARLATIMPNVAPRVRVNLRNTIPLVEFIQQIDNDQAEWRGFPWPSIDGGTMRGDLDSQ